MYAWVLGFPGLGNHEEEEGRERQSSHRIEKERVVMALSQENVAQTASQLG